MRGQDLAEGVFGVVRSGCEVEDAREDELSELRAQYNALGESFASVADRVTALEAQGSREGNTASTAGAKSSPQLAVSIPI